MRLESFDPSEQEPLGEGDTNTVFINPHNEQRVIVERKGEREHDTPRQIKGTYYLTKIVHIFFPNNIPDIYQAGESGTGTQQIDRERITHSLGQKHLQAARQVGGDEQDAKAEMLSEMEPEMIEITSKLESIGLGFVIDENVGNYSKDEAGGVYYLESFKPWAIDSSGCDVLFDEEALNEAILALPDEAKKEECTRYLDRLLALLEEEKKELQDRQETSSHELFPEVKEIETLFNDFESTHLVGLLRAITTEAEARSSPERAAANELIKVILEKFRALEINKNITSEKYIELDNKYRILANAVGYISRGLVDHNR